MATHYQGDTATRRALNAFIALTRANNWVASRMQQSITAHNLSQSQFGVLEALFHLGPMCQRDLAEKILKSGGNLTMVIDNLEKNGLVERVRNQQDRRYVQVTLTNAGQILIERIFPDHASDICRTFSVLNNSEQEQLAVLCRKLGKGIAELDNSH